MYSVKKDNYGINSIYVQHRDKMFGFNDDTMYAGDRVDYGGTLGNDHIPIYWQKSGYPEDTPDQEMMMQMEGWALSDYSPPTGLVRPHHGGQKPRGFLGEEQENIFQEFYQLNNSERDRKKGIGLGLSIVKRLSKILGAQISLSSSPTGSIFQLDIPNTPTKPTFPSNDNGSSSSKHFDKLDDLKVVIIENETDVRESMESLLESWGCICLSAANEEAATLKLNNIQNNDKAAMILDYRLSNNQTGIICAKNLTKHLGRVIPIIIITGDTEGKLLKEISSSGYTLMHKPIESDELFKHLEKIFSACS